MKKLLPSFKLAALMVAFSAAQFSVPAWAQEDEEAAEEAVEDEDSKPKVAAAKPAKKEDPDDAGDVAGYKFPRGIYTQSDLGIFWRYLGFADTGGANQCFRCRYPTYYVSNGQPFIGFSVGYDILPTVFDYIPQVKVPWIVKRFGISAQLSLATGYVANAAPYSASRSFADQRTAKPEDSPKDHAILMATPAVAFNFNLIAPSVPSGLTNPDIINFWSRAAGVVERTVLEARIIAGAASFTPSTQRYEKGFQDPKWWLGTFGGNFGLGLSIKYMTLLTNFVIGSDLAIYNMFSPGWGAELFIPPFGGRPYGPNDPAPTGTGGIFASGNGRTNILLPFIVGSSFSPIIIKYVF